MNEIVWIVQQTETITKWFKNVWNIPRGIENIIGSRKSNLLWYESSISNYVVGHAHLFSDSKLEWAWFELNLGDPRNTDDLEHRFQPDLILQFSNNLWLVEVKYEDYPPKKGTKRIQQVIDQLKVYEKQIKQLQKKGWLPGRVLNLSVFWGYRTKRKNSTSEILSRDWPVKLSSK